MQTQLNLNFNHHAEALHQAAKRQLLLTLAAALALGALMLLPALAKAEDADQMIGTNAPHQERSASAAAPRPALGSRNAARRGLPVALTALTRQVN